MNASDALAILAVLLTAAAILPGTLGILMLTNRIAASPAGARFIYSHSRYLVIMALAILAFALYLQVSPIAIGCAVAVALLLVYGFLMHAKLLFRPVTAPTFISVDEAIAKFGPDEEVVGVIDGNGEPFAFVARLARRPHIVYQPEGNAPFIMTHCILAHSSMSYALEGNFSNPDITITAALANNMVFYEKSNRCSVVQIHNRLQGRDDSLATIPTVMTSLATWQRLYPDSPVWMRPREWRDVFYLKLLARAEVIDPASPVMVYPLEHELDQRLPMKAYVLGVTNDAESRAYPIDSINGVVNDQLADLSLAIFRDEDYLQVFDRRIAGGRTLTFDKADDDRGFVDHESGSRWNATGTCLRGEHAGKELRAIPHYNKIFWFVWSDYFPNCDIYSRADQSKAA